MKNPLNVGLLQPNTNQLINLLEVNPNNLSIAILSLRDVDILLKREKFTPRVATKLLNALLEREVAKNHIRNANKRFGELAHNALLEKLLSQPAILTLTFFAGVTEEMWRSRTQSGILQIIAHKAMIQIFAETLINHYKDLAFHRLYTEDYVITWGYLSQHNGVKHQRTMCEFARQENSLTPELETILHLVEVHTGQTVFVYRKERIQD